mmetsp:Transcript_36400/g.64139  ORF Transcript_36400/g.64139 Transcript_36400/m.64139 type:complete len:218 (+) Transcript_36400:934-1587(+)
MPQLLDDQEKPGNFILLILNFLTQLVHFLCVVNDNGLNSRRRRWPWQVLTRWRVAFALHCHHFCFRRRCFGWWPLPEGVKCCVCLRNPFCKCRHNVLMRFPTGTAHEAVHLCRTAVCLAEPSADFGADVPVQRFLHGVVSWRIHHAIDLHEQLAQHTLRRLQRHFRPIQGLRIVLHLFVLLNAPITFFWSMRPRWAVRWRTWFALHPPGIGCYAICL